MHKHEIVLHCLSKLLVHLVSVEKAANLPHSGIKFHSFHRRVPDFFLVFSLNSANASCCKS